MVDVQIDGEVGRVFLNRPQKANALGAEMLDALYGAIARVSAEERVRVVVLAGRGKTFCGGADVRELAALDASSSGSFLGKIHAACAALRALPMPVVAELHGAVIGAGLELAAACDLRIAAEGTKFSMPEVRIGIPSVVEAALLPRLIGSGRAAWLVLTGEAIDARRALEWGLVEQIGGDEAVSRVIDALLKGDRAALSAQKRLLQLWEQAPLAESIPKSIELFAALKR